MPAWTRICCPLDFSPPRFGMEAASELAWRFGGELTLLHVVERVPRPVASAILASPTEVLELTGFEPRAGARRVEGCGDAHRVEAGRLLLRPGRSRDRDRVGTHGKTELEHGVLGSVAENGVREA